MVTQFLTISAAFPANEVYESLLEQRFPSYDLYHLVLLS